MSVTKKDYEKALKGLPNFSEWRASKMRVWVVCEDGIDRMFTFECTLKAIKEPEDTVRIYKTA